MLEASGVLHGVCERGNMHRKRRFIKGAFCMLLAVLLTLAFGCRKEPLCQAGETRLAKTGETLFVLEGGGLARPVEIPLWVELDLSSADDAEKCMMQNEFFFFRLPDKRIYVGQYNAWCGGEAQCRLLDPKTQKFERPPGGCLESGGIHMRAKPLETSDRNKEASKDNWLAVHHEAEGVAWVDFVTYAPSEGTKRHLTLDLFHDGQVQAKVVPGGLFVTSNFDLFKQQENLVVKDPENAPLRRYRWTPEGGLKPLDADL